MSTNRYFDSQERQDSRNSSGGSYTDRFRTDAPSELNRYATRPSHSATASDRLKSMIERACRPTLLEPDLAVNLEIADLINSKKGNLPREAANKIVSLVNSSNPHVSILAMGVLDICVKNCGYPFHLQISRKEFLNELVKRFPERPPFTYSRTQILVLGAIEEWRQTICRTSKYKDDFGYIRDMHRLLSYKGYTFPEVNKDDAAVLNPTDTLKSPQELEEEERDAQSAKLDELLRRGTPADLQEANHLMSIMAGFREQKTDFRAKAAKDLDKVRRKGEILEEMMLHIDPSIGISGSDDVFTEIVDALKNAKPKIQKMIDAEGEEDEEALVKLLALNDYISALVEKYSLIKDSKFDEASRVSVVAVPGTEHRRKADTSSKAAITQSLIDIDDEDVPNAPASQTAATTSSTTDDLLGALDGLSFGNPAPVGQATTASSSNTADLLGDFGQISLGSPSAPASRSNTVSPVGNSGTDYSALQSLSQSPLPSSNTPTSAANPFAISNNQPLSSESEWNFGSTPAFNPPTTQPSGTKVDLLNSTSLGITSYVTSETANSLKVQIMFSNNDSIQAVKNLNFQFAVPKSYQLKMENQSGSEIAPGVKNGITQIIHITNPSASSTGFSKLKFRWKADYNLGVKKEATDGTVDHIPGI